MLSNFFKRPLALVSAWGAAFVLLCASAAEAQEFKPFLSLHTAGPTVLVNVVESVMDTFDPTDESGMKAQLAPFKNLPGTNAAGTMGLAIQVNKDAPFGLDAVIVLPINDFAAFTIPGMDPMQMMMMMKAMMGQPADGKYTMVSPLGNIIAYQKPNFFILATEGAADFAGTVDPQTLFAGLQEFSLGWTVHLENVSLEDIEMVLEKVAFPLALIGMEVDPEEIMMMIDVAAESLGPGQRQFIADTASFTQGLTLDPQTLYATASQLSVPRTGSALAEKFFNMKNARTKFGGFLQETPKTVASYWYLDYFTDAEIEEIEMSAELITEGFIEGLLEGAGGDEGAEAAALFADAFQEWMVNLIDYFDQNRLVDTAMTLDSDGIALFAAAIEPALMQDLAEQLRSLVPLLASWDAEQTQAFIEDKINRDYETIAGYSLSGLPDIFADLPEDIEVTAFLNLPAWSFYWAVKGDESIAFAVGLDAAKTESALKAALTASVAPTQPRQTGMIALKPLGQFLQSQLLPLMETEETADVAQLREAFSKLAAADAGAKMVITTEYPNEAQLQTWQIDGRVLATFFEFWKTGGKLQPVLLP